MAQHTTTQRLQNEFLTCPRCSNSFKDPKALPCLHNLCKACLQEHINEEMGGSRHTSFTCPVCSSKIFVPDPSKPTGVWANQFPSNFVIKGMMDAIASGSPQAASPPGAQGQHPLAKSGSVDRQGAPASPSSQYRDRVAKEGRGADLGTDLIIYFVVFIILYLYTIMLVGGIVFVDLIFFSQSMQVP